MNCIRVTTTPCRSTRSHICQRYSYNIVISIGRFFYPMNCIRYSNIFGSCIVRHNNILFYFSTIASVPTVFYSFRRCFLYSSRKQLKYILWLLIWNLFRKFFFYVVINLRRIHILPFSIFILLWICNYYRIFITIV